MSDSSGNENLLKEMWPIGKLVDVQIKITGENGGYSLLGALNGREEGKAVFFDSVSIERVGFCSYLSGQNAISEVAQEALDMLIRYKMGDYRAIESLEQFLISNMHDSVGRE